MEDQENTLKLLQNGYILYQKDGIIKAEEIPKYGEVTFYFHDGKFTHMKRIETKK